MRSIFFAIGIAALLGSIGGSAAARQASPISLKPMTIDRGFVVGSHGCGRNDGKFVRSSFVLARLPAVTGRVKGETVTGKAEGVTVLDIAKDKAQIVILFDGLANGAPHLATITIPPLSRSR